MKEKFLKRKKIILISLVAIMALVAVAMYPSISNEIKYNSQIALAKEKLKAELFDEAKEHMYEAEKHKELEEDDEKILSDIKNIKESSEAYNSAEKLFSEGKYMNAAKKYNEVIQEDSSRYGSAVEKKEQSIQKYLESGALETFEKAGSYSLAKTELETLQQLTENENKSNFDERIAQYRVKIKEQQELEVQKKKEERIQQLKSSIRISEVYTSKPNSIGGININLKFQNLSDKTLTSMSFRAVPYNSAGEVVGDYYSGMIRNMVGPGKTEESYWSNAWLDTSVTSAKLIQVKLSYADGTDTTIKIEGDELQHIIY